MYEPPVQLLYHNDPGRFCQKAEAIIRDGVENTLPNRLDFYVLLSSDMSLIQTNRQNGADQLEDLYQQNQQYNCHI